jgi:hypothetical protein
MNKYRFEILISALDALPDDIKDSKVGKSTNIGYLTYLLYIPRNCLIMPIFVDLPTLLSLMSSGNASSADMRISNLLDASEGLLASLQMTYRNLKIITHFQLILTQSGRTHCEIWQLKTHI